MQGRTESLEAYTCRFKVLFQESAANEAMAARHFVWNMTDEGKAMFATRLEREYGAPGRPELMEQQLATIPLATQFEMASVGEWLSWVRPAADRRRNPQVLQLATVEEGESEELPPPPASSTNQPNPNRSGKNWKRNRKVTWGQNTVYPPRQGGLANNVDRPNHARVAAT